MASEAKTGWRDRLRVAAGRRPLILFVIVVLAIVGGLVGTRLLASGEPAPTGSPPMLRRLTEAQYRATIADIFGPDIQVSARFERPVREGGLIAIGTAQAGMSPFAVEQYDAAAQAIASAALDDQHRRRTIPCFTGSDRLFDAPCARSFVTDIGRQLFRRPLTEQETARYVSLISRANDHFGSFRQGLQLGLYTLLVSPDFLFRIEHPGQADDNGLAQLDAFSKATRLSFFLTNSTPDRELLRAAAEGELDTSWGLSRQVDRLMQSPRFEGAVRAFFTDMMQFDRFSELTKDPAIYPAFTPEVAADAQEQTLRTIVDLLVTRRGDYRDLFTTRDTFLTRPLGVIYRAPVSVRNGWQPVQFGADDGRAGIQNHISFLALHSHPGRSSPTLRGRALREIFLCQEVPDPPANVNFANLEQTIRRPMVTARDRIAMHATEPSCAGCHAVMDPLGLTMEQYDGIGRFRPQENGAPIDLSGSLDGTDVDSPASLAAALHDHREAPRCLVERMYKSAVGRDITWDERSYLDWLIGGFMRDGYRVPDLMRRIATSRHFFAVSASPEDAARIASNAPATGEGS